MNITKEDCARIINNFTEASVQLRRTEKFLKENVAEFEQIYMEQNNGSKADAEIQKYMDLPYSIVIKKNVGTICYYTANVLELDSCMGSGRTYEEAYQDVMEMMRLTIKHSLENNIPIPLPA